MDDDAAAAQERGEGVVLLAGPLRPEDVVEEQLVDVGRREPLSSSAGPVHHDLPQHPDLGVHAERHGDDPARRP